MNLFNDTILDIEKDFKNKHNKQKKIKAEEVECMVFLNSVFLVFLRYAKEYPSMAQHFGIQPDTYKTTWRRKVKYYRIDFYLNGSYNNGGLGDFLYISPDGEVYVGTVHKRGPVNYYTNEGSHVYKFYSLNTLQLEDLIRNHNYTQEIVWIIKNCVGMLCHFVDHYDNGRIRFKSRLNKTQIETQIKENFKQNIMMRAAVNAERYKKQGD